MKQMQNKKKRTRMNDERGVVIYELGKCKM